MRRSNDERSLANLISTVAEDLKAVCGYSLNGTLSLLELSVSEEHNGLDPALD
jgi:hypothetical protein